MKKINTYQICLLALAAGINIIGAQIALVFRLPIYLDSIGTIFVGAFMGPWFGTLPTLISGLILGFTTDIYSLYFAPAGMVTGFMAGVVFRRMEKKKMSIFLATIPIITLGSFISACICAGLFDGVTSSGSAVLVRLLSETPLGLLGSIFLVQFLTEYIDRLLTVMLICVFLKKIPVDIKEKLKG